MKARVGYTDVFFKNYEAYKAGYRYVVNQGSARSSKTYSIMQVLDELARYSPVAKTISVVGKTRPFLKRGVLNDYLNYLRNGGYYNDELYNKTELAFIVGISRIEFFSVDQPEKVFAAARDLLYIDEANTMTEETFRQLAIRTRGAIFMSFNPTHEFWALTDIVKRPNACFIKSSYKNNPYLDENIKQELHEAGERNQNFKRVFVDGEIGVPQDLIFTNWEIGEFDETLDVVFGEDYGYSNDPTTLVKIAVDDKKHVIYLDECYYKKGLTTKQIFELNKQYAGDRLIVGDRSEVRLIDELRFMGNNIVAADNTDGAGLISTGLITMQDYLLVVTPTSTNLQSELKSYVWLDERGKMAIDKFNHAIDASRYGFMYQRFKIKQKFFVV